MISGKNAGPRALCSFGAFSSAVKRLPAFGLWWYSFTEWPAYGKTDNRLPDTKERSLQLKISGQFGLKMDNRQ